MLEATARTSSTEFSASVMSIDKTDLMDPGPRIKAYYERCFARPAWQRTLALYAERVGMNVDDIR